MPMTATKSTPTIAASTRERTALLARDGRRVEAHNGATATLERRIAGARRAARRDGFALVGSRIGARVPKT
jgi:hypothetical protein